MGDRDAVERVDEPVTVPGMVEAFRDLGIRAGDTLLVHSSLSSIGWVSGGQQAVVDALREAVTDDGTLVVPTHTPQYSDPAGWSNPPVPDDWIPIIRESRPAYRPDVTPSWGVGVIPECFRTYPDAVRSRHPVYSFAAWGADAEAVVRDHAYDDGLGEHSPLARVYERDGDVLMLGTGYGTNTSLHLAEYRADVTSERRTNRVPVIEAGERAFVEYGEPATSTDDFPDLGAAFEAEVGVAEGSVGDADAKLVDQPSLVDFAVEWFEANR